MASYLTVECLHVYKGILGVLPQFVLHFTCKSLYPQELRTQVSLSSIALYFSKEHSQGHFHQLFTLEATR